MSAKRIVISLILLAALAIQALPVSPAAAATPADWARFVADVSIPDGTVIAPGGAFTKTWRLTNIGATTWTTSYKLVFESGELLGAKTSLNLPKAVKPGESIDLSVNMTAPVTTGTFRGNWKLQNASGVRFGIGSAASNPFWVEIKVASGFGIAYDFAAKLCDATWSSAKGRLPCPATTHSADGSVRKLDAPKYENGLVDNKPGILAVPQSVFNGYIAGVYPAFRVQPGDKFQAIIGCEPESTGCYVRFRLDYRIGSGDLKTFWSFYEKLDGQYYRANVDLTPLAGQDVRFTLTVHTAGLATGDRALWGNPVILRGGTGVTLTPSPTPTVTLTRTPTVTPGGPTLTASPTPSASPTPPPAASCDRAAYVSDITVPDGTTFTAGSNFTKIWRLKNVGTCAWTNTYTLNFKSGDQLNGPLSVPLPQAVAPGQTVDVPVNLVAPLFDGNYRGNWILKNGSGVEFGIGSGYKSTIYVEIRVSAASGGVLFDFVSTACNATWQSQASGALPCPGKDGDTGGFVYIQTAPRLEDGKVDGDPALITAPHQTTDGFIRGIYPAFTPVTGDRFKATIGCDYGTSFCDVIIQVDYKIGNNPIQTMYQKNEVLDGANTTINLDLSPYAGTPIQIILTVLSNGPATNDRAQWLFPHIYRAPGVPITPGPSPTRTPGPTATPTLTHTPTLTPLPTNTLTVRASPTP